MKQTLYIKLILQCLGILLLAFISSTGFAASVAGTVQLVEGTVWIQGADNKIRSIDVDQPIYQGDVIITGKDGELQARMQDEAIIAVRANSKLKIESYRAEGDEDDNAVFSLIVGTFRSITGWIGKYNRKNYAIKTTAATIGVRGTDHEPMYIPPPVPGMKPLGEPGVYDKVNSGRIVMKNQYGESEFGKGQAGFIGLNTKRAPTRLKNIPTFFKPTRNEKQIVDIKKRQLKRLDQGLIERQRKHQQLNKARPTGKPMPKLLNMRPQRSGFVPAPGKPEPKKPMPAPKKDLDKKPVPQLQPLQRPQIQAPLPNMKPQQVKPVEPRTLKPVPGTLDQSMLQKKTPVQLKTPTQLTPTRTTPTSNNKTTPTNNEKQDDTKKMPDSTSLQRLTTPKTGTTLSPTNQLQYKPVQPLQQPVLIQSR